MASTPRRVVAVEIARLYKCCRRRGDAAMFADRCLYMYRLLICTTYTTYGACNRLFTQVPNHIPRKADTPIGLSLRLSQAISLTLYPFAVMSLSSMI